MGRLIWTCAAVVFGLLIISWALMVPAHLRAIDAAMLPASGRGTVSVVEYGADLVRGGQVGAAEIVAAVATELDLARRETVLAALDSVEDVELISWGGPAPQLTALWGADDRFGSRPSIPIARWLNSKWARVRALEHLEGAPSFGVRQVLLCRGLTNLTKFPPLTSAAGPAWDAATLLVGMLLEGGHVSKRLEGDLESLALGAVRRGQVPGFELACLDVLTLGNRLNWGQLTRLLEVVESRETLGTLADLARTHSSDFPMIYAASLLLGSPRALVGYVLDYGEAGVGDVRFALRSGRGALAHLVDGALRVQYPNIRNRLMEYEPFYSAFLPLRAAATSGRWAALGLKAGLLLLGGWLLAQGLAFFAPLFDGDGPARMVGPGQLFFAVGVALLVLAFTEPFLVQPPERLEFPLRWDFPMVGKDVRTTIEEQIRPIMDVLTAASLVGFLAIQGVIYGICLLKLAEIRRQPVSTQLKLKLLENEENMFDAGLYVGLGGTVASLVLLAVGIVKASLMAAYASTLFGIIFVAVLRICHLRPLRKVLILSTEAR